MQPTLKRALQAKKAATTAGRRSPDSRWRTSSRRRDGLAHRVSLRALALAPDNADARVWLLLDAAASDDAGFITGSTLSINGGQHMY